MLFSILNGDSVLDRIQNGEGGGDTHKLYESKIFLVLNLNNSGTVGATHFILVLFYS